MVECNFCSESVAMPYKCSLCYSKFCGKHRLPEAHECINIGVFQTEEYRSSKLSKSRESRLIYAEDSYSSATTGYSRLGQTWSTGNKDKDMIVGGMLLGLTAILPLAFYNIMFAIIYFPFTMIFGVIFVYILYFIRNTGATKYGMGTGVVIYPVGIAITFILSVFGRPWILIGKFINIGSSTLDKEAKVALYMVFGSLFIYFLGPLIIVFTDVDVSQYSSFSKFIIIGLFIGLLLTSSMFAMVALLTMLPIWGLEGTIIYAWNPRNYFIVLALVILCIIINFSLDTISYLNDNII